MPFFTNARHVTITDSHLNNITGDQHNYFVAPSRQSRTMVHSSPKTGSNDHATHNGGPPGTMKPNDGHDCSQHCQYILRDDRLDKLTSCLINIASRPQPATSPYTPPGRRWAQGSDLGKLVFLTRRVSDRSCRAPSCTYTDHLQILSRTATRASCNIQVTSR